MLEDDDLPVLVIVVHRLVDRAQRDVVGHEVPHVALDVVPVRKAGQLAAGGADVVNVLPQFFRIAELNREVADDRKSVEVEEMEGAEVIGARQLERRGIREDVHSVGRLDAVVRRFLGDDHIVRMRFAQA